MKYDATPVTAIARAASSPIWTMKPTSGPEGPFSPRSRVCCTTTGMTTWPMVATIASASVPHRPSRSSGETAMPRRMVSRAAMSSPVSTWEVVLVTLMRGLRGRASGARGTGG
jgi:hypothetical protein